VLYSPLSIRLVDTIMAWKGSGFLLSLYNLCHVPSTSSERTETERSKDHPSHIFAVTTGAGLPLTMSTPSSSTPQPTSSQQPQSAAATPQFVAYPLAPGQQPQLPPQASGSNEARTQPQTRLPSAETRKDRSLVDFLLMLDDYEPLVRVLRNPLGNAPPDSRGV
jgi:hypothetical protein